MKALFLANAEILHNICIHTIKVNVVFQLLHASLYGTSVPDLIRIHFLGSCGSLVVHAGGEMVTLEFLRHALTGTTTVGSGGCVCSSVDTGWYSGSFESMVVSFTIADPNRE